MKLLRDIVKMEIGRFMNKDGVTTVTNDFRQFWILHSIAFPSLAMVALRVCSLPTSESAVERGFANLGNVLTELRTRLDDETISNLMFFHLKAAIKPPEFEEFPIPSNADVTSLIEFFFVGFQKKAAATAEKFKKGDRVGVVFRTSAGMPYISNCTIHGRSKKNPDKCWEVFWETAEETGDWNPNQDFHYYVLDASVKSAAKPAKRPRT